MRCNRGILTLIAACLTVALLLLILRSKEEFSHSENRKFHDTRSVDTDKIRENTRERFYQVNRHVTPSLAELGERGILPEMNKDILMLTRVPGAGSETLVFTLQHLQGKNGFKHIRLPPDDQGSLTTLQQELLVEDITSIIRQEAVPLSFDGNVRFLNFSAYGRQAPTFISLVRDPLDPRILERFQREGPEALYQGAISYFCGHMPACTKKKSKWALNQAKENVIRWYPIVAILDHMEDSLMQLEKEFPNFFSGATNVYAANLSSKMASLTKVTLKPRTMKILRKYLADEVEFYKWLKFRLINKTLTFDNG
ncbi:uronyl 2-sulfotransferase-like [Prorops nasuta]|uniref:uronyl 2-sulfotransferase-like n=1 Tax=Prorops nasuta TaxID=863751 RepID=UPI0034CF45B2